jgi:hypothetical protein
MKKQNSQTNMSSSITFAIIHFFSNAVQSQSRTMLDVVLKWFGRVIAKVGLKIHTRHHCDCWKEAIHGGTDLNFPTCKFIFIIRGHFNYG